MLPKNIEPESKHQDPTPSLGKIQGTEEHDTRRSNETNLKCG